MVAIREARDGCRFSPAGLVIGVLSLALLTIVSDGCQRTAGGTALKDRVAKYWELSQSKEWEQVYDAYLDPTVKSQLTKPAFLERRRLAYDTLSYEINEVQDENDAGTVTVTSEVNIPLKTPAGELRLIKKRITTKEQWVRRDGVWYVELAQ
jgi:hypothetical protein